MPLDLTLLGSKLKRYRKQFDSSIKEISIKTGISENRLLEFEAGEKQPNGDEILILADLYKCDYKFFISNEKLAPFEQTETLFRKYGKEFSKEDRWAIQEFLFLCECEEFLINILNKLNRSFFTFIKTGGHYKVQGEQSAASLRLHLGYSPTDLVFDVYEVFRRIGFHIFRRKLVNLNISGLYIKHPNAGKCILVNYNEDVYRQRFTAAHEAAHAIIDDENDFIVSYVYDQKTLSEIRANTFASRFLLPIELLKNIPSLNIWSNGKAIQVANRLNVSTTALSIALENANLITSNDAKLIKSAIIPFKDKNDPELHRTLPLKSRKRREELIKIGLSSFYVGLCFDAYDEKLISSGRLCEMLLVSENELNDLAKLYGRYLHYDD